MNCKQTLMAVALAIAGPAALADCMSDEQAAKYPVVVTFK